jgi:thiamine monophosphate synthase
MSLRCDYVAVGRFNATLTTEGILAGRIAGLLYLEQASINGLVQRMVRQGWIRLAPTRAIGGYSESSSLSADGRSAREPSLARKN